MAQQPPGQGSQQVAGIAQQPPGHGSHGQGIAQQPPGHASWETLGEATGTQAVAGMRAAGRGAWEALAGAVREAASGTGRTNLVVGTVAPALGAERVATTGAGSGRDVIV
jgi:hypothetical protein